MGLRWKKAAKRGIQIAALASCLMPSTVLQAEEADTTASTSLSDTRILVHGHRGARARKPENTLSAFRYALEAGVDVLEMDLGVTSDNVLVISHDGYINTDICQFGNGQPAKNVTIRSLTLKQLKEYDCGSKKNSKFPDQEPAAGEQIPTLDEVFDWIKASDLARAKAVQFNIEMKIDPVRPERPRYNVPPAAFATLLNENIQKHRMAERVIVQSFVPEGLMALKQIAPHIRRSMLIEKGQKQYMELLSATGASILSPEFGFLSPSRVRQIRAAGIELAPWTVNTPKDWARMVELKVNAIITDDPESLIRYLKSRNPE